MASSFGMRFVIVMAVVRSISKASLHGPHSQVDDAVTGATFSVDPSNLAEARLAQAALQMAGVEAGAMPLGSWTEVKESLRDPVHPILLLVQRALRVIIQAAARPGPLG